jgi:hypothetical protein
MVMKFYNELRKLEDDIIRLDTLQSVLKIVADGVTSSEEQDVQHSLWFILDELKDINQKVSRQFYDLWNHVRDDSRKEPISDYIAPSETNNELMKIVNSWVRQGEQN